MACLVENTRYLTKISTLLKNQKFIFEDKSYLRKKNTIIELFDSDDSDDSITDYNDGPSYSNSQETKLSESIHEIWNKTVKPLVTVQKKKITNYLISKRSKLISERDKLNNVMREVENNLKNLFKSIYKYENQQKFEFDEEISIVDITDVVMLGTKRLCRTKKKGKLIRSLLKVGEKVYGMKYSQLQPWVNATIKSAVSDTYFNIIFDDGKEKILNNKGLAYINTSEAWYPVGSRVIAKFQDMNIQLTDKFYVGVVAEPANYLNNSRFVIKYILINTLGNL